MEEAREMLVKQHKECKAATEAAQEEDNSPATEERLKKKWQMQKESYENIVKPRNLAEHQEAVDSGITDAQLGIMRGSPKPKAKEVVPVCQPCRLEEPHECLYPQCKRKGKPKVRFAVE